MAFAIKIMGPVSNDGWGPKPGNTVRYFSQKIETMTRRGITDLIIITDGKDPSEIDLSETLVEAERKLNAIQYTTKKYVFKIIEYPEGNTEL